MASGTASTASAATPTTTSTTDVTAPTARLTRGALKKITNANAAETSEQTLLQQYVTFQHGLPTPKAKRRRVGSSTSESTTENDDQQHHDDVAAGDQENQAPSTTNLEPTMAVVDTSANAVSQCTDDESKAAIGTVSDKPTETTGIVDDSIVAVTPTVAEIALPLAEKKLDGAPEGELFVVTVLLSSEIAAASDVDAEVAAVHEVLAVKAAAEADDASGADVKDETELSWAKEYAALDSLRRLAIHHREQLAALTEEHQIVAQLVCPAAMNLRSAMVRNALLCIQDLVVATKQDSEQFYGDIVPVLLQRTANEKQFIRDLAHNALTMCVESCPGEKLLIELLRISTTERNAQIVSVAGLYTQKCIGRMDKAKLKTFVLTHETFMEDMSAFLNCKVVECKAAARRTLQYLRRHIGNAEFTALAKAKLDGTAQFELLKAAEEKKAAPVKSGLPKLSMRERMLQMKKQQAAHGSASTTGATDDVVVLVPDATR